MDKRHQSLLEKNYTALLDVMNVEAMLDCMRGSSLFGLQSEEVERAARGVTNRERGRLIIEALMRKGPDAFPFFVSALHKTSAYKALAEKLAEEGMVSIQDLNAERDKPASSSKGGPQRPVQVSGLPPLPFQSPASIEDDPRHLYQRRDIYGERATVRAMPVSEENLHSGKGELVFGRRSFSYPGTC
eukprot:scpid87821/ scgid27114/ 